MLQGANPTENTFAFALSQSFRWSSNSSADAVSVGAGRCQRGGTKAVAVLQRRKTTPYWPVLPAPRSEDGDRGGTLSCEAPNRESLYSRNLVDDCFDEAFLAASGNSA